MGRLPQAPSGAPFGAVAQLVAHLHGMEGVRGSSPLSSTDRAASRAEAARSRSHGSGGGGPDTSRAGPTTSRAGPTRQDGHLGEPRCPSKSGSCLPPAGVGEECCDRRSLAATSGGGWRCRSRADQGQNHSDSRSLGLTSDASRISVGRESRTRPLGAVAVVAAKRTRVMPSRRPMTLLRRCCQRVGSSRCGRRWWARGWLSRLRCCPPRVAPGGSPAHRPLGARCSETSTRRASSERMTRWGRHAGVHARSQRGVMGR